MTTIKTVWLVAASARRRPAVPNHTPTPAQVPELMALEQRATPGPWFDQYDYDGGRSVCQMRSTDTTYCVNRAEHVAGNPWERTKENGHLIASLRNAAPGLLVSWLAMHEENAQLREALDGMTKERDAALAQLAMAREVYDMATDLADAAIVTTAPVVSTYVARLKADGAAEELRSMAKGLRDESDRFVSPSRLLLMAFADRLESRADALESNISTLSPQKGGAE